MPKLKSLMPVAATTLLTLGLLAGCATDKPDPFADLSCPKVGLVDDARIATNFVGENFTEEDYYSRATISDFRGGCEFTQEQVRVEFDVTFTGELGPAATRDKPPKEQAFDYFVAVLSPDNKVLVKDVRPVEFEFGRSETMTATKDRVALRIPLEDPFLGPDYKVTLGFQLTAAQLEFNRRNKKRFPGE